MTELRALPRQAGVNVFRASLAQERVWALEQLVPGSPLHNLTHVFRSDGRLDLAMLRLSLEAVVARHESLRTTFAAADGVPMQVVSPIAAASLRIVDLRRSDRTEAESSELARAAIVVESARPFELMAGPLFRVVVFLVSDVTEVVCVGLHHLIADAWSATILVRELVEAYMAGMAGRPARLAPLSYQYADYAEWQRERLHGSSADVSMEYWRAQLRAAPYPTLPGASTRRSRTLGAAADVRRVLPASLAEAVRRVGREVGATFFAVLLATWQLLLARWTEESDVTILSPIANRVRPGAADLIGFFVNVVPLRTRVTKDLRFRDLVSRVREVVRAAHRHQEVPFEKLVADTSTVRTLSRPPMTPFGLALEQGVFDRISLPDVELHAVEVEPTVTSTDLLLVARERTADVEMRLEYDRDRFGAATAAGILRELEGCLTRAVADPKQCVADLATAAWGEVHQADSFAEPAAFWQRFAAQVDRSPDAIAAQCGAELMTYRDLAQRADAVAGALRVRGVAHQAIVAVWGTRDLGLLCAILGVLRAGAVYLPLDPRLPTSRAAQILRQSRARVVVGDDVPRALLDACGEAPLVLVSLADAIASPAGGGPSWGPVHVLPSDLAYVIYTSGSTGQPKGAMIEHAGLLNHLEAKIALLDLGASDRVAQTASSGFDVSIWQFLAVLLVGGRVEIVPDPDARDPRRLQAVVARAAITVIETVPALLRLLLETADRNDASLSALRWLIVTGDVLPPDLCRRWLTQYPEIPIVNAYGPTECSDDVTHHVVRTPPDHDTVRIPVGRPIASTAIFVLADDLTEVATGEVGEICVAGLGVGRGYLHDPVRTAEAFVANPFAPSGSTRLYRTGDHGRWRADGTLECLGRIDRQVKIRGMRVEIGEIEAVLMQHPAVRDAAVVACVDPGPEPRLVAYLVLGERNPPPAGAVRAFLTERLPDAMVPSAFVVATSLPLGANGKVDRRALAELSVAEPEVSDDGLRPATATERVLLDLWSEILQVEVRSIDDNFFALGGDSLASIRVAARARRHGLVIAPSQIFEHQTVASLASVATKASTCEADQGLVVGDVELTPIQRMFFAADLPEPEHYNMACLVELDGGVVASTMTLAVQRLLQHHDALRLRFRRESDGWRAWIAGLDGPVPFAVVDLASREDGQMRAAIETLASEVQASLRLDVGPIVRVTLFDLGAHRPSRLLIVVHHLACDVVSWPILLEDLAQLYGGLLAGESVVLPPKTASVRQWARHLNERGAGCIDEVGYWQHECEGESSAARLPRDLAGTDATIATIEHVRSALEADETEAMRRLIAEHKVSLETVLLAVLATAVTSEAGGDSLMVYVEHHGRDAVELDLSRTVGWGTVVFPFRVSVAASRRMPETVALVDRHLREVPRGGIGYGLLRFGSHEAEIAASLPELPRPEVSLNYLGCTDLSAGDEWRLARESCGREFGRGGRRPTVLDVTGYLANGALHVDWAYGATLHRPATIARLATRGLDCLRAWIAEGAA